MSDMYLKNDFKAEPLIWGWYAWPYLIPPITAGCNIVERHLKIMQSYVKNPQIHAQAVKDPAMLGGPFIDLGGEKVDEVQKLIEKTKDECKTLIALDTAIKELDRLLQNEAVGDTLEEIYPKVPDMLKGLVELVYDLNCHPSIRLIEPLIYKHYYSNNNQTISLSVNSDIRTFALSTPRINDEGQVHVKIPFKSVLIDDLFKMKEKPGNYKEIEKKLNIQEDKIKLFRSFFTDTAPKIPQDRNYTGNDVRMRYFGHACLLVQTKSVSVLFDPVISYASDSHNISKYTIQDLPDKIDYVVITHNHQDHILFETLLQIRHKVKNIVFAANNTGALEDPSIKLILKNIGFSSLIELKEMDTIDLDDGKLIALPFFGEHSDLNIQSKLSYCLELKGSKFIFAADSSNLEPMLYERIFDYIGGIDMLFLGMECDGAPLTWLYGPLLSKPLKRSYDNNRTLSGSNFDKAWGIVKKSKAKEMYIYAMGQEPWLNYIMALEYSENSPQIIESNKLLQVCKNEGIIAERLFGQKEWVIPSKK